MKTLLALLATTLLGLGSLGCGDSSRPQSARLASETGTASVSAAQSTATTTQPPTTQQPPTDFDKDNDGNGKRHDEDDATVLDYGQAAGAPVKQAVTRLVERYYAAAAASNGATACSLLYSLIGESVAEEYGQPPGPPALRGSTCAVVMSKLFKQNQARLGAEDATLKVIAVRIKGKRGLALLTSKALPERHMPIHLEHGVWKIFDLTDSELG